MPLTILVTGGAGYIGSHTILELLNAGHSVICVDNCCNAYHDQSEKLPESLKRVQEITGKEVNFQRIDIRDKKPLDDVFKKVCLLIKCKLLIYLIKLLAMVVVLANGFQLLGIHLCIK